MDTDTPAVLGGKPTLEGKILPIRSEPSINEDEVREVSRVLRSRQLSIYSSEEVTKFEREFGEFIGARKATAVTSGTAAIHTAMGALGIGRGDEVIMPAYGYFAIASSTLLRNATPVFADTYANNGLIDSESVKKLVNHRTKAIVVVHMFGFPVDFDPILEIAKANAVPIIEDCAHACGALWRNKKVGTLGAIGCFSFSETKNMTTGEGGAVATNDTNLAERARLFAHEGQIFQDGHPATDFDHQVPITSQPVFTEIAPNYRMSAVQAAIGRVQLRKLPRLNEIRRQKASLLTDLVTDIKEIKPVQAYDSSLPVYQSFPVVLTEQYTGRDGLMELLIREGVQASPYYPLPIPLNPVFTTGDLQGHQQIISPQIEHQRLMGAQSFCNRHFLLPFSPEISDTDLHGVAKATRKIFNFVRSFEHQS